MGENKNFMPTNQEDGIYLKYYTPDPFSKLVKMWEIECFQEPPRKRGLIFFGNDGGEQDLLCKTINVLLIYEEIGVYLKYC